jgi:hypothetical protein
MTDAELARALERCDLQNAEFHHESHLRVAWVYLDECRSVDHAVERMAEALRRFAASVGRGEKYHHTITAFWVIALDRVRSSLPGATLTELLGAYPQLRDKDLPLAFYSRDRLFSDDARLSWVEPDQRELGIENSEF